MNTKVTASLAGGKKQSGKKLLMAGALALVVTACASAPPTPDGAIAVREQLTALQNNPNLNDRAQVEIGEAEQAVRLAEMPVSEEEAALGEHRVYMAERKVGIAEATATKNYAESQRELLVEAREEARLRARTLEADRAQTSANRAEAEARRAREAAEEARLDQAQIRAKSAREAEELQERIADLEAEATERGLVLTLDDVLFATGSAELQGGPNTTLEKVVDFLKEYPERNVAIEGHTDNVGEASYNQVLSQQRADTVKAYFSQQGIASYRITTKGLGEAQPAASNDNPTGRQQNRRVEIIIENAPGN